MFQNPQAWCYGIDRVSTHTWRNRHQDEHAAASYRNIVIISEDADVFIILFTLHFEIGTRFLPRRGKKNNMRLIDISKLGTMLRRDICASLIRIHAWTGCDSINSFAGQVKVRPLNLIRKKQEFREVSMALDQEWHVTDEMLHTIHSMYVGIQLSRKSIHSGMKCSLQRRVTFYLESSPPCKDALEQHTYRSNYQTAKWRRNLQKRYIIQRTDMSGM